MNRWLDRSVGRESPIELGRLLCRATDALCEQALTALGSVTMTAILGRVFHRAEAHYPFLSNAYGKSISRHFDLERLTAVPAAELIEGMRFVLTELLTVTGMLTAEILTPELHAALNDVEGS